MAYSSLSILKSGTSVEFLDVKDEYYCGEDLICTYKLNDYTPKKGDKLGIFKVGPIEDYIVFTSVSTELKYIYTVVFDKSMLPEEYDDCFYQIRYINTENDSLGTSSSFQISSEKVKGYYRDDLPPRVFTVEPLSDDDLEIKIRRLTMENDSGNSLLKYIKSVTRDTMEKYDQDIAELYRETERLKTFSEKQREEIKLLKTKVMAGKKKQGRPTTSSWIDLPMN